MNRKHLVIACLSFVAFGASLHTRADTWPDRPISLIVPWAAGGSTDTIARVLSEDLSRRLNTLIVVENKPGAGGTIGSSQLARAKPDGYTFMLGVSGDQINAQFMYANLNYRPSEDIVPVSTVARESIAIAGNMRLPVTDITSLLNLARQQPLDYGTSGIGSTGHLAGELLKRRTQTDLKAVPYKGAAPAITDAIAGHVDLVIASPATIIEHVKARNLRVFAVTSPVRIPQLPDVPTLKERGYDVEVDTWYMMMAPSQTPREIVTRMSEVVRASLTAPTVQARIVQLGATPQGSTPEELATLLKKERTTWGKVIQDAGLSARNN